MRMRIAMLTLAIGDDYLEAVRPGIEGKAAYCAKHGYQFMLGTEPLSDRPPSWSKIPFLLQHLRSHDWLFWSDADVVIMNDSIELDGFVGSRRGDLIITRDSNGINAGNFFLMNSAWSSDFLRRVWDRTAYIDHPWWENAAMSAVLAEDGEDMAHVRVVPQGRFNSYMETYERGDFLVHFPARHSLPTLSDLMAQWAGRASGVTTVPESDDDAEPSVTEGPASRDDLGEFLNRRGLRGEGVEVGVAQGKYAEALLSTWEGRLLHLVDPWRHLAGYVDISNVSDEAHEENLRTAMRALSRFGDRFRIHRMLSEEAVVLFQDRSIDFVYLDANHAYEQVSKDIVRWWPKIRPGGILAGHDYVDGVLPSGVYGVKSAVSEFQRTSGLSLGVSMEEEWPSWFIMKPA